MTLQILWLWEMLLKNILDYVWIYSTNVITKIEHVQEQKLHLKQCQNIRIYQPSIERFNLYATIYVKKFKVLGKFEFKFQVKFWGF